MQIDTLNSALPLRGVGIPHRHTVSDVAVEIPLGFPADMARCPEEGEVVVGDEGEEVDFVAEPEGKTQEWVE